MITSRRQMKDWLAVEAEKLGIRHFWLQWLTGSEFACIYHYMWVLRHVELMEYRRSRHKWLYAVPYLFYYVLLRKLRIRYGIHLGPGDAGRGFHLVHLGFFRSYGITKFGENCTVLPLTLFGKRIPGTADKWQITTGDNCYFGTGCTVLAPCRIGNNVTVAAGAVVTLSEIPDNAIVAGVPAKIVKYKEK